MRVKIVCFILLVQASIISAAPAPNRMQSIRLQRDSENGSGDSCCTRQPKLEVLKDPGIYIRFCAFY